MTQLLPVDEGFEPALSVLRSGGLVAVPTETVYGLAADAMNADAVAKIYAAKGRPSFNPLICHVSGLAMAQRFGGFDGLSARLAEKFWPGPLTLIVKLRAGCGLADGVSAGLPTIALRHPHGVMSALAEQLGSPIAAPSANSSGKVSPTLAQHVMDDLGGKVDLVLDAGPCRVGVESTIVKVENGDVTLLREGGIATETLEAFLDMPLLRNVREPKIEAPGQLLAHYAPRLPLRLNETECAPDEALLAFGPQTQDHPVQLNLSPTGDVQEAAHNLFAMLQKLDRSGAKAIAVQPIPMHGLGAALNDRLKRAAHQG